jgi:hypothetical protein
MTQESLLLHIGNLWYKHKNYMKTLISHYQYGMISNGSKRKLIKADWYINEIENYYKGCSCLEEEDICKLIVETQKILN